MCSKPIVPTINFWRSYSQSAEHVLDLLTVLGCMINDLNHEHPSLHVVAIPRLELRLQGFLLTSRQRQQPITAFTCGLLQLGECHGGENESLFKRQGQGS